MTGVARHACTVKVFLPVFRLVNELDCVLSGYYWDTNAWKDAHFRADNCRITSRKCAAVGRRTGRYGQQLR